TFSNKPRKRKNARRSSRRIPRGEPKRSLGASGLVPAGFFPGPCPGCVGIRRAPFQPRAAYPGKLGIRQKAKQAGGRRRGGVLSSPSPNGAHPLCCTPFLPFEEATWSASFGPREGVRSGARDGCR